MANSVRELIMQNVKATLSAIRVSDGYNFNMSTDTVQRWSMFGNRAIDYPYYVIDMAQETEEPVPNPKVSLRLSITVSAYYVQDESDTNDTGLYINRMLADIKKALLVDVTRGGNAIDTKITESTKFSTEEGQESTGIIVGIDVLYQHVLGDPYTN